MDSQLVMSLALAINSLALWSAAGAIDRAAQMVAQGVVKIADIIQAIHDDTPIKTVKGEEIMKLDQAGLIAWLAADTVPVNGDPGFNAWAIHRKRLALYEMHLLESCALDGISFFGNGWDFTWTWGQIRNDEVPTYWKGSEKDFWKMIKAMYGYEPRRIY